MRHIGSIALLVFMSSVGARAEGSAKTILQLYDKGTTEERETIEAYTSGAENAFGYAASANALAGQSRLYCQPLKLALTSQQVLDMVRRSVTDGAKPTDFDPPFVMSILIALEETFPCAGERQKSRPKFP